MTRSAQLRLASLAAEIAMQAAWMHIPQESLATLDRIPGWEAA